MGQHHIQKRSCTEGSRTEPQHGKDRKKMKNDRKKPVQEKDDCQLLTDEEFKAYQEKDKRTTNKVLKFFKAIWEAINFFN